MASRATSPAVLPGTAESLTHRQRAVLRQAARCNALVTIFEFPGGRREQLGAATWNVTDTDLPSDAEVRELVRLGHLIPGPPSPATTFSITEQGRAAARG